MVIARPSQFTGKIEQKKEVYGEVLFEMQTPGGRMTEGGMGRMGILKV